MGGSLRSFPSTPGFLKGTPLPAWGEALDELTKLYWRPVYLFLRMVRRLSNDDAKDLAQQFFLHLLQHRTVERYRPSRGSFRPYLKTCLRNFLADDRRRREARPEVPLPDADAVEAPDADAEFERGWVQSVLETALARAREDLLAAGRGPDWDLFEAYDLCDADAPPSTYAELGRVQGRSEADVRNALAFVRGRLRDRVVEEVRRLVSDPEELAAELAHLGFL